MFGRVRKLVICFALIIFLAFWLFPVLWTFLTSLKIGIDAWTMPPKWVFTPTIKNYVIVLFEKNFIRYISNSAIIAVASTAISVSLGSLAAYGLARYPIPGKRILFFVILFAYMVPAIAIALPLYLTAASLGLLDTHLILILAHCTFNTAFATWMMRGFFKEIPIELEERARLDGCSEFGVFRRIALPLVAPGLVATSVICLMFSWNDFPFALVLAGHQTTTIPVAIGQLESPWGTLWGELCACTIVAIIPMVIFGFIVQKWLVRGLTMGAIK